MMEIGLWEVISRKEFSLEMVEGREKCLSSSMCPSAFFTGW